MSIRRKSQQLFDDRASTGLSASSWRLNVGMALAVLSAPFLAHASPISDNPAGWQLAFSDEFTGTALDSSKWAHRGLGPRKGAINTANAVAVKDGLLTITTYTSGGAHYTGMIATQGMFEQTYGYYEARIKFQDSPGQWSAFWLQSPGYGPVGDPATAGTEIDIVEHRAANQNDRDIRERYSSAVHWDGYAESHQQLSKVHTNPTGLGNGSWHTYGMQWTEAGYQFYFDDELIWTALAPVSKRPEYLILSSEVENGVWAGTIPAAGYGAFASSVTNVQVDYVRVYSQVVPPLPSADFNRDGRVDGADLPYWKSGMLGGVAADANGDGKTDGADFLLWQRQFSAASSLQGAASPIPEPSALNLLLAAALLRFRRSSRSGCAKKLDKSPPENGRQLCYRAESQPAL